MAHAVEVLIETIACGRIKIKHHFKANKMNCNRSLRTRIRGVEKLLNRASAQVLNILLP